MHPFPAVPLDLRADVTPISLSTEPTWLDYTDGWDTGVRIAYTEPPQHEEITWYQQLPDFGGPRRHQLRRSRGARVRAVHDNYGGEIVVDLFTARDSMAAVYTDSSTQPVAALGEIRPERDHWETRWCVFFSQHYFRSRQDRAQAPCRWYPNVETALTALTVACLY